MSFGMGLAFMVIGFLLLAVFLHGMVWTSKNALPWLFDAGALALAACVFLLLPLSIFTRTRPWAATGFLISSYIFGCLLWAFGCIVAFNSWGYNGLIIGLCLAGVGVVPVALLAALLHREWTLVFNLTIGLVLTFGVRYLSAHLLALKRAEESTEIAVPFVCCPSCDDGWLIASEHPECFDQQWGVWRFVCPDCGKPFQVPRGEVRTRKVGVGFVKERYPGLSERSASVR
jgi:hypothetical protein